jgi:hypothetical protein
MLNEIGHIYPSQESLSIGVDKRSQAGNGVKCRKRTRMDMS